MTEHRNRTGFTLIEMLIAMTMIALIVSMVYGSYAATSESRRIYDDRLTCAERANLVLRLMSRQIRCAYAPPNEPNETESTPGAAPVPIETSPHVFYGHARDPRGEVLGFVTTTGLGGGLSTQRGLAHVRYRYDPTAGTLSIHQGLHEKRSEANPRVTAWQPILQRVAAVEVAFHDGRQWRSEWKDRRTRRLPRAVRIHLTVLDENDREHRFGTAVPIVCRTGEAPTTSKRKTGGPR